MYNIQKFNTTHITRTTNLSLYMRRQYHIFVEPCLHGSDSEIRSNLKSFIPKLTYLIFDSNFNYTIWTLLPKKYRDIAPLSNIYFVD